MATSINREALIALREKDGQTMAELARNAGLTRARLNDIEKGRWGATPDVRKRLARALNVPTSAIESPLSEHIEKEAS